MNVKDILSEKIAGEITLSPKPGKTIRKWRIKAQKRNSKKGNLSRSMSSRQTCSNL